MRPFLGRCLHVFTVVVACASSLRAAHADDTRTSPVVEAGAQFYTGSSKKSVTGSLGYALAFRSEGLRDSWRPYVAAEFEFAQGTASLAAGKSAYTLYGGSFLPGYNFFVFKEGYFQPFFGFNAILGWDFLHLTSPPGVVEAYTQGFAYGYEVSTGVDIRVKRTDSTAIRLRCSLWTQYSMVGGSTLQMNGFRFILGMVY